MTALATSASPSVQSKRTSHKHSAVKYTARYLLVLEAAARQFADKGYRAATTKDIAGSLGVRQASLYYYIRSKESALEQICGVAIEGYVGFSKEILGSKQSTAEKIADLVYRHLKTLEERPGFYKVFLAHRHELGAEARHVLGRQIREYERNVEAILRQGVRRDELRGDRDYRLATLAILGMCNAVVTWWGKRSNASIRTLADEFTRLVVDGLRAGGPRAPRSG